MRITEYLYSKPRTKRDIARAAGIPTREVELLIQAARLEGMPILSDGRGYWLTTDPAEVKRCAERLRSRAIRQMETAQALGKTAESMVKPTLWGGV